MICQQTQQLIFLSINLQEQLHSKGCTGGIPSKVLTPASFLHLQVCFGRFMSSRRNGKRATIQNLFSKHQHIQKIKKEKTLSFQSVCSLFAHGNSQNWFISGRCCSTSQKPVCITEELPIIPIHKTFSQHSFLPKMVQKNYLCTTAEVVL